MPIEDSWSLELMKFMTGSYEQGPQREEAGTFVIIRRRRLYEEGLQISRGLRGNCHDRCRSGTQGCTSSHTGDNDLRGQHSRTDLIYTYCVC